MPQNTTSPTQGPFDLTFDATFQNYLPQSGPIAADPCRAPGVHLGWLSNTGWAFYPFLGYVDTDSVAEAVGSFEQGGLQIDSQRTEQLVLTLRAGGLTYDDSLILSGVNKSAYTYAIAPGPDGYMRAVRVYAEPGTLPVWRDAFGRMNVEVKIRFSKSKSARA